MSPCYSFFQKFCRLVHFSSLKLYILWYQPTAFKNSNLGSRIQLISDSILQFKDDKVEGFVKINSIQQVYASIQNFGSAALNLTCSNYDSACGTVKRKTVNKFLSHESIFNLKYEITTVLVLKQYDCLIYDYTFEVLSSMFALLMTYLVRK